MKIETDQPTIAIMGDRVPVLYDEIEIDQLKFLPDNPRVSVAIRKIKNFDKLIDEEMQDCIYKHLLKESSVKNLIPEIVRDGGLQEPIIIRHDTNQVIEGNSRLAVYKKLWEETREEQWRRIRCIIVSKFTSEQQIRLLGQAHLRGKTEWSPYAKALLCFHWIIERKMNVKELEEISGLTVDTINKNIKIIQLMSENKDDKLSNFSYYEVLVRARAISSAVEQNIDLKKTLFSQIKAEDFTAQEMRDHLPFVIKKSRILKKYLKGKINLEDAFDLAKISSIEKHLKDIENKLDNINKNDINNLENNEIRSIQQIIRKIKRHINRISDMIENSISIKNN